MYKALDLWLPSYLRRPRFRKPAGTIDILLAICDHFEPRHGADKPAALERIHRWQREYPKLIEPFLDADGCRLRHTFFYPVEQYDSDIVSKLTELCHLCGGEVELHLHHDGDTATGLRGKLEQGKENLAGHNLLARDARSAVRYGFVHGNWALDDSHPQGRYCGVPNELGILKETGCYADFTMPSAPDPTQTRIINSIYYAPDTPEPKSHDTGTPACVKDSQKPSAESGGQKHPSTPTPHLSPSGLLLVQGPLGLNWEQHKFGLLPRLENGEITGANPPRLDRMRVWLRLGVHVLGRPDWIFVKLHTHGGIPRNMAALLADPMQRFLEHALAEYNDGKKYRLHFVTAREMVNIIHAAEDGQKGNAGRFRNYRYVSLIGTTPTPVS